MRGMDVFQNQTRQEHGWTLMVEVIDLHQSTNCGKFCFFQRTN